MAQWTRDAFFINNEFEEGMEIVNTKYKRKESIVRILSEIIKYADRKASNREEKERIFNYLVFYLQHLAKRDLNDRYAEQVLLFAYDEELSQIDTQSIELISELLEELEEMEEDEW